MVNFLNLIFILINLVLVLIYLETILKVVLNLKLYEIVIFKKSK